MSRPKTPLIATDILIKYQGNLVLIKRRDYPHGIAIPGGMLEYGLTTEQNAIKEAKEETNLDIKIQALLGVYSDPERDPRGHVVSVVYVALGKGKLRAGDDAKEVILCGYNHLEYLLATNDRKEVDKIVFDHPKIIRDFLEYERKKSC